MKQDKVELMLAMIEQRLNAYSVEETVERLRSYECAGPTISEFVSSFASGYLVEAEVGRDRELPIYSSHSIELLRFCLESYQSGTWYADAVAPNDEWYDGPDDACINYGLAA
jgi:hypothetical protein